MEWILLNLTRYITFAVTADAVFCSLHVNQCVAALHMDWSDGPWRIQISRVRLSVHLRHAWPIFMQAFAEVSLWLMDGCRQPILDFQTQNVHPCTDCISFLHVCCQNMNYLFRVTSLSKKLWVCGQVGSRWNTDYWHPAFVLSHLQIIISFPHPNSVCVETRFRIPIWLLALYTSRYVERPGMQSIEQGRPTAD
jgi:hypothetical protein